jgi:hypothetical protein
MENTTGFIASNLEESAYPLLKGKWYASEFIIKYDIINFLYLGKSQDYIFESILNNQYFIFFDNYEDCQLFCINKNKIK